MLPIAILLPLHMVLQQPAERVYLDSLTNQLVNTTAAAQLPDENDCTAWSQNLIRLCQALVIERRAELTGSKDDALRADQLMERTVAEEPKWATGWYGLGVTRLELAKLGVFSREGPLQPAGMSNVQGAANALVHALELDPDLPIAVNALAAAPEPREGSKALADRVAMLRAERKLLTPEGMAQTANLERDGGSVDSAIALEQRALASGHVDSGVVLLALARDFYKTDRPDDGHAALVEGAGINTDATHTAYRRELEWVASPAELAVWDTLSPSLRSGWLDDFWAERDVAEGRPAGARLIEHYRRIEYAMKNFRVQLPETGRQQMLTYTSSGEYQGERDAMKYAQANPEKCPDAATFANDDEMMGADAPFRYYKPVQDQVDDRGVVWIRHGKPDKVVSNINDIAVEVWTYHLPTGPLVLQFREADFGGSAQANTMVPTLLTISPGILDQICDPETLPCPAWPKFGPITPQDTNLVPPVGDDSACADVVARILNRVVHYGNMTPEKIAHARDKGRAMIDEATTTDGFPRDFSHAVHPSVQMVALLNVLDSTPRLVVAYALPGNELSHDSLGFGSGRLLYPVRVQLMAARRRDGKRVDQDVNHQFTTTSVLGKGQYLTAAEEMTVPPGRYSASIVFTQRDGRGAVANDPAVTVTGPGAALALSDLVLGREGSGAEWSSGGMVVPLDPFNSYPVGGSAQVYFQITGMRAGTTYSSRFEVFDASDSLFRKPRLTLVFNEPAHPGVAEVLRTVGLANLEAGDYRIRLTVRGASQQAESVGAFSILKP
jgi:GWxTD domain-containing protein